MATIRFFQNIPKPVVGIILLLGSGFDAATVISAFQEHPELVAIFVIIKSMIIKFEKLYRGIEDEQLGNR